MLGMVKDYWAESYREIPCWGISAVSLALLYVFNLAHVIPMCLSASAICRRHHRAFCLKLVQHELERYQEWQAAQARTGKVVDV